jgi:hypothetical protein
VPSPSELDRAAERLLERALSSTTRTASVVTALALVVVTAALLVGAAALARGPVCTALDKQSGGAYCEALPTPTPTG